MVFSNQVLLADGKSCADDRSQMMNNFDSIVVRQLDKYMRGTSRLREPSLGGAVPWHALLPRYLPYLYLKSAPRVHTNSKATKFLHSEYSWRLGQIFLLSSLEATFFERAAEQEINTAI